MTNDTGMNDVGAAMQLSQLPSQAAKLTEGLPAIQLSQGSQSLVSPVVRESSPAPVQDSGNI